ncbi:MAG: hypothetical protein COU31_00865 [Candidatus Magasanikbacteria bacterium CG10_big_fil_rev_8_21_14_0_10_40_10]|uniref:DUF2335 domain-containing protein n=1 Tax=Candidatus Magasanikbacteria bacterium CG10_big_fil_rev_8_21_14_0_10_40_10 TaxID=1974648 RepID=A0A2M6W505_9BACT|nr:MAG: hypothetical protein COU31_00865 [Candidatus Magasanikbacteria bacterium CG10_big_fil_rev_8_21_14_0_10_40_10]
MTKDLNKVIADNKDHSNANCKKRSMIEISQMWSAPLPPPNLFKQYEEVLPGLGDRITTMAEKNQKHRISMERLMLWGETSLNVLGLLLSFLIVVLGMLLGVYLIIKDKSIEGFLSILTPLGIMGGAFILQKRRERKQ